MNIRCRRGQRIFSELPLGVFRSPILCITIQNIDHSNL